jgi:sec-independent protein translocase protein TatB
MNILGMGPTEILLIVVLALIVFGPAKLPEIMGQVGKAINDFRKATTDLSDEFNRTIQAELKETRSVVDETKAAVTEAHTSVTSALGSSLPAPTRTAAPAETAPTPDGAPPAAASNGSVPAESTPPLADTSQWSWETAAPAAPKTAETAEAQPAQTALAVTSASDEAASPTTSPATTQPTPRPPSAGSRPAPKRTARDELLPPY